MGIKSNNLFENWHNRQVTASHSSCSFYLTIREQDSPFIRLIKVIASIFTAYPAALFAYFSSIFRASPASLKTAQNMPTILLTPPPSNSPDLIDWIGQDPFTTPFLEYCDLLTLNSLKKIYPSTQGAIDTHIRKRLPRKGGLLACAGNSCDLMSEESKALNQELCSSQDIQRIAELIQTLKDRGNMVEINTHYTGASPLELAALSGNLKKVKMLVEQGDAKECILDSEKNPTVGALYCAAQKAHFEVVAYLLSKGAVVDCFYINSYPKYLLLLVLRSWCALDVDQNMKNMQFRCLDLLLFYAPPSHLKLICDYNSPNAIEIAFHAGREDLVNALIVADFKWSSLESVDSRQHLLCQAVRKGHTSLVRWLVEAYAMNINAQDDNGITPLFRAAFYRKEETLQCLLKLGADETVLVAGQNYKDFAKQNLSKEASRVLRGYLTHFDGKWSPFQEWSPFQDVYDCISLLLPEDINQVGEDGDTLLHLMAKQPSTEYFSRLIEKGAKRDLLNRKNETAYQVGVAAIEAYRIQPEERTRDIESLQKAFKYSL